MRSPLLRLLPWLRARPALLAVGSTGMVGAAALGLIGPWLIARAIDVDLPNADRDGLVRRCLAYGAVVLGAGALTWGSRLALEVAAQEALLRLKTDLFAHLVGHDLAFHDRTPSGSLVGRIQGDITALRLLLVEVVFAVPADTVLVLGVAAMLLWNAPIVGLPVLAVMPAYALLLAVFRRVAGPRFLAHRAASSRLTGVLAEVVRVAPRLQAFGGHLWLRDRADDAIADVERTEFLSRVQPVWFFNVALGMRALAIVGVLVWGAARVRAGQATVGELVLALGLLRAVFGPLMRLSQHLATLEAARAAARRVADLLDVPRTLVDPAVPAPWPGVRDRVALEGVGFHYVEGTPVLQDVDLVLPAGTRTGLVGRTGSGKSTVVDLILRFRDVVQGRVTFDGVDVRALDRSDLRARCGLVLQDVRLIPGTVRDNLPGDPDAVRRALDAVGLDWSLDRPLDEARLSRGERQLLTFARALVRDPELLVLDEATSAVDPATEHRVQQALDVVLAGRTALIVAHRLQTILSCDQVIVFDGGRVVEQGSPSELAARGGAFAALLRAQAAP